MNKVVFYNKLTSGIFYLSILLFIIAFNFTDNGGGGWTQQFLPSNLPGITDITFTDSLTGYAVTAVGTGNSSYIIKTTNGGDNWNLILQDSGGRAFTKVNFINSVTGFACTKWNSGSAKLYKTINGGDNWSLLNNPPLGPSYLDLSVLSENELWIVDNIAFDGGVYRTTDGGQTWDRKYYDVSRPADRVYMINSRIGFIADGFLTNSKLWKTSNAGNNWSLLSGYGFYKMEFIDSLEGYKSDGSLKHTLDGGLNWETILPIQQGNPPHVIRDFSLLNDTIWGVNPSGNILYPNNQFRGVIYRSTNRGMNWGYQLPDTSFRIPFFVFCDFVNKNVGWAYSGVHTITGGDTITNPLTSINNPSTQVIDHYILSQNYPNPFNPKTKISFELQKAGIVKLTVFDIQGKNIAVLVNGNKQVGKYETDFDGSNYSSGIYFYKLEISGKEIYSDTKRMILLK